MKKQLTILVIFIFVFGLFNIEYSEAEGIPKAFSISPTQIQIGDSITLTGENFPTWDRLSTNCTTQGGGGTTETSAWVTITEAPLGTNYLCFDCNTTCFYDFPFEVCKTPNCEEIPAPTITSVSPTTARINEAGQNTIDIIGQNFNNATASEIEKWSRKSISGTGGTAEIIYTSDTKITLKFDSSSKAG